MSRKRNDSLDHIKAAADRDLKFFYGGIVLTAMIVAGMAIYSYHHKDDETAPSSPQTEQQDQVSADMITDEDIAQAMTATGFAPQPN